MKTQKKNIDSKLFDKESELKLLKETSIWILSILATIVSYIAIAWLVFKTYTPDIDKILENAKQLSFLPISSFLPEPKENLLFYIAVLSMCLGLVGFYYVFKNMTKKWTFEVAKNANKILIFIAAFVVVFIAYKGIVADNLYIDRKDLAEEIATNLTYYFWDMLIFNNWQFFTFICFPLILGLLYFYQKTQSLPTLNKVISISVTLICAVLIILLAPLNTYKECYTWPGQIHLNASYGSVVQLFNGNPLFVDGFSNTYGGYPYFLLPILKVTGLSILAFTRIMAVLLIVTYSIFFYTLSKNVKNKIILLLGFCTLIFWGNIYQKIGHPDQYDSYFQYFPLRMIFPAILILFGYLYANKPSKFLYYLSFLILPFSILWNPETGMIVTLAWSFFLCFLELKNGNILTILKKSLKHLIFTIAGVFFTFLFLAIIVKLFYGVFPDYASLFSMLMVFSQLGFFMLPMPLWHPWNLFFIVYLFGLMYAIKSVYNKQYSPKTNFIFLLTIVGIGMFIYYEGRSHNFNLYNVSYPFFMLLTIFADDLFGIYDKYKKRIYLIPLTMILFLLSISPISLLATKKIEPSITKKDAKRIYNQTDRPRISANTLFIKENTHPKEKVFILSSLKYQCFYFEGSKTRSAVNPTIVDISLKEDLLHWQNVLLDSAFSIFLDPGSFYYTHFSDITATIAASAEVEKTNEYMAMLKKKKEYSLSQSVFANNENTVFYKYFTNDKKGVFDRVSAATEGFEPITTSNSFTIEIIFKPSVQLYANPCLISNSTDSSGFFISMQSPQSLLVGTNNRGFNIPIQGTQWCYVAVNFQDDMMSVYVNGQHVGNMEMDKIYQNANSRLYVGNVPDLRYFVGSISETAISNNILSANTINERWNKIQSIIKE